MKSEQLQMEKRLKNYTYIVAALLLILALRLGMLQLLNNETYQTQAKENRIRLISIKAPRGEIVTREGDILAANELVYSLTLTFQGLDEQDKMIDNLLEILADYYPEMNRKAIEEKVELQQYRLYEPITLIRDIPWELVVEVEENRQNLPGVEIVVEPLRYYPNDALAGHVLGYIHSINADELDKYPDDGYNINSLIGKSGIEKEYENEIKGIDGARSVEVDAKGHPIREQVTLEPQQGNNIELTLDFELQQVMQNSMEKMLKQVQEKHPKAKVGSAVLLNVKTGEVLAMCSSPLMYPDDWKGNISNERAAYYFPQTESYDPMYPGGFLNRTIQVSYPPGSTFKPITGMAALEKGVVDPATDYVNCNGRYWIAPYIPCWSVHGAVNYYSGMAGSCNVYFQEMGRRAGNEEISKVAEQFGLGSRTGIDLPYEVSGLLPTSDWKQEVNSVLTDRQYKNKREQLEEKYAALLEDAEDEAAKNKLLKQKENEKAQLEAQYKIDYNWNTAWHPFDTFNMSIGEGDNDYTVLQLANYVATLANGGHRMKPYMVSRIYDQEGNTVKTFKPEVVKEIDILPETISETKRAMLSVAQPGGTAYFLFSNFPQEIQVGAKTGTAAARHVGGTSTDEYNGVFVAFAPYDDPEIAFAGIVEYGNHGSESAGLVAKDVFEQYFGIKDHLAEIEGTVPNNVSNDAGD